MRPLRFHEGLGINFQYLFLAWLWLGFGLALAWLGFGLALAWLGLGGLAWGWWVGGEGSFGFNSKPLTHR